MATVEFQRPLLLVFEVDTGNTSLTTRDFVTPPAVISWPLGSFQLSDSIKSRLGQSTEHSPGLDNLKPQIPSNSNSGCDRGARGHEGSTRITLAPQSKGNTQSISTAKHDVNPLPLCMQDGWHSVVHKATVASCELEIFIRISIQSVQQFLDRLLLLFTSEWFCSTDLKLWPLPDSDLYVKEHYPLKSGTSVLLLQG